MFSVSPKTINIIENVTYPFPYHGVHSRDIWVTIKYFYQVHRNRRFPNKVTFNNHTDFRRTNFFYILIPDGFKMLPPNRVILRRIVRISGIESLNKDFRYFVTILKINTPIMQPIFCVILVIPS